MVTAYNSILISLLISAMLVVLARNPIYALLALVLLVVNLSFTWFILGLKLLALLLLIIYLGAVCVLFLFTLMMLPPSMGRDLSSSALPAVLIVSFILLFDFGTVTLGNTGLTLLPLTTAQLLALELYLVSQSRLIFLSAVLLLAMIAAIQLTLTHQRYVRRQDLVLQVWVSSSLKLIR